MYFVINSIQVSNRLIEATSDLQGVFGVYGNSDPVQALQEILRLRPEIVVLDIRMKGEVGFDLLKQLKDELPETIRIVFTWWIAQEYEDESMNAGADYFYGNGDEFEDLFDTIGKEARNIAGGKYGNDRRCFHPQGKDVYRK